MVPSTVAHAVPQEVIETFKGPADVIGRLAQHHLDMVAQLRRHKLIGIQAQHPVAGEPLQPEIRLVGKGIEPTLHHRGAEAPADVRRLIGAHVIDHEHLIRPGNPLQAGCDLVGLVLREDQRGERVPSLNHSALHSQTAFGCEDVVFREDFRQMNTADHASAAGDRAARSRA